MPRALLILVRDRPGPPLPPTAWAIGRAALSLVGDVPIVFGQTVRDGLATGLRVESDGSWTRAAEVPVGLVAMRFPRRSRPAPFLAALDGLQSAPWPIPIVNALEFSDLAADKVATQHALEACVRMPEIELDASAFPARVAQWGAAFLKPRFGSLGDGVRLLRPGDPIGRLDGDWLLQRAVSPPRGLAGLCLRVLVQREGSGWTVPPSVARLSEDDPTVSVERGARVAVAADAVTPAALAAVESAAVAVATRLGDQGPWDSEGVVEMGVDFVLDRDDRPYVLEVNSIPRGRLASLAELDPRHRVHHEAAVRRPLARMLARLAC